MDIKIVFYCFISLILSSCITSNKKPFIACLHPDLSGRNCQIYSSNGKELFAPASSAEVYRSGDGLFRINENNNWSLVSSDGQVVFNKTNVDYIGEWAQGYRSFRQVNDKKSSFGFLKTIDDTQLLTIYVPAHYDEVTSFSENKAAVRKIDWSVPLNWRTGYINFENKPVIDYKIIGTGHPFHDGLAIITTYKNKIQSNEAVKTDFYEEQMGLINESGQAVIKPCDYYVKWLGDKRWLVDVKDSLESSSQCEFKQDSIVNENGQVINPKLTKLEFEKILNRKFILFHPAGNEKNFSFVVVDKLSAKVTRTFHHFNDLKIGSIMDPVVLASSSDYIIYDPVKHVKQKQNPYSYLKQVGPNQFMAMNTFNNEYQYALIDKNGRTLIDYSPDEIQIEFGSEKITEPISDQLFIDDWDSNIFRRTIKTSNQIKRIWYNIDGQIILEKILSI